jgi:hypothetical protein
MAAMEVVATVGGEHDQPLRGQPGEQEDQQIAAGAVGPVQVLDDEQGRRHRRERIEGGEDGVEHPQLAQRAVGAGGVVAHDGARQEAAQGRPLADDLGVRRRE